MIHQGVANREYLECNGGITREDQITMRIAGLICLFIASSHAFKLNGQCVCRTVALSK